MNPLAADCAAQAEQATARAVAGGASGDVYGKCCLQPEDDPFCSPVIQERAWTSPIWIGPAAGK